MTIGELVDQLAKLPREHLVFVWDFGAGGTVEANEVEVGDDGVTVGYNRTDEDWKK